VLITPASMLTTSVSMRPYDDDDSENDDHLFGSLSESDDDLMQVL
jgi:hypothetical protein